MYLDLLDYFQYWDGLAQTRVSYGVFLGSCKTSEHIFHVSFTVKIFRFEAGTPAIGEAVGLGAAVDYLSKIGMDRVHEYEVLLWYY